MSDLTKMTIGELRRDAIDHAGAAHGTACVHELARRLERAEAKANDLKSERDGLAGDRRRWSEAALAHYPPNWAHDGRPESIIKNIVRYQEEQIRRWSREAEAARAFLTESGGVVPSPAIAHHWEYRDARDENERAEKELERERQIADAWERGTKHE